MFVYCLLEICYFYLLVAGTPISKNNDTAKIALITLGVTVALSTAVLGMIFYRRTQKKNKRYSMKLLCHSNFFCALIVSNLLRFCFDFLRLW